MNTVPLLLNTSGDTIFNLSRSRVSCLLISIEENCSKEKRQALLKHGDGGAGWLSTESSEACGVIYMYV